MCQQHLRTCQTLLEASKLCPPLSVSTVIDAVQSDTRLLCCPPHAHLISCLAGEMRLLVGSLPQNVSSNLLCPQIEPSLSGYEQESTPLTPSSTIVHSMMSLIRLKLLGCKHATSTHARLKCCYVYLCIQLLRNLFFLALGAKFSTNAARFWRARKEGKYDNFLQY